MFVAYPDAGPWSSDNTHHPPGDVTDKWFSPAGKTSGKVINASVTVDGYRASYTAQRLEIFY